MHFIEEILLFRYADVTMSGSRVPIANHIDQTLLNKNPSILDHVNQSFEYDYDAITLPFTKSSWKDRWQRYCVANEEDVKKGRARASYIAGQSGSFFFSTLLIISYRQHRKCGTG